MKSAALCYLSTILLVFCGDQDKDNNIGSKTITELNQAEIKQGDRTIVLTGAMLIDGRGGKPLGFACCRELELLQGAGMQPTDGIQVARLFDAEFIKLSRRLGSVGEGKLADFILLDRNTFQKYLPCVGSDV